MDGRGSRPVQVPWPSNAPPSEATNVGGRIIESSVLLLLYCLLCLRATCSRMNVSERRGGLGIEAADHGSFIQRHRVGESWTWLRRWLIICAAHGESVTGLQ